jgi:hypothetical protein
VPFHAQCAKAAKKEEGAEDDSHGRPQQWLAEKVNQKSYFVR